VRQHGLLGSEVHVGPEHVVGAGLDHREVEWSEARADLDELVVQRRVPTVERSMRREEALRSHERERGGALAPDRVDEHAGAVDLEQQGRVPEPGHVDLVMSERNAVEIDYCANCRGVWLDRGELDKILERAGSEFGSGSSGMAGQPDRSFKRHDSDEHRAHGYGKKRSFLHELFD